MTTSIFYKSYQKDFEFLKYSLRSVIRFTTGFKEIVVVSDAAEPKPPVGSVEKHYFIHEKEAKYCHQQVLKLNADSFTDSDVIVFGDSDTLFTSQIQPEDLMENGKPIWLYEPYQGMTNPDVLARQKVVGEFLGESVQFEFMRRHPFIITRELLVDLRRFCWRKHGVSLDDYMMSHQDSLSEFNLAGCWLYAHRHSDVAWKSPQDVPVFVRQFWSHSGINDSTRAEMEAILA